MEATLEMGRRCRVTERKSETEGQCWQCCSQWFICHFFLESTNQTKIMFEPNISYTFYSGSRLDTEASLTGSTFVFHPADLYLCPHNRLSIHPAAVLWGPAPCPSAACEGRAARSLLPGPEARPSSHPQGWNWQIIQIWHSVHSKWVTQIKMRTNNVIRQRKHSFVDNVFKVVVIFNDELAFLCYRFPRWTLWVVWLSLWLRLHSLKVLSSSHVQLSDLSQSTTQRARWKIPFSINIWIAQTVGDQAEWLVHVRRIEFKCLHGRVRPQCASLRSFLSQHSAPLCWLEDGDPRDRKIIKDEKRVGNTVEKNIKGKQILFCGCVLPSVQVHEVGVCVCARACVWVCVCILGAACKWET